MPEARVVIPQNLRDGYLQREALAIELTVICDDLEPRTSSTFAELKPNQRRADPAQRSVQIPEYV